MNRLAERPLSGLSVQPARGHLGSVLVIWETILESSRSLSAAVTGPQ